MARKSQGTRHSARAMQLAVKLYKQMGGRYEGSKGKSLQKWTKEKWGYAPGSRVRDRYLPKGVWDQLSPSQRLSTRRKKRGRMGEWIPNTPKVREIHPNPIKRRVDKSWVRNNWRKLFNLTPSQIQKFLDSDYGRVAGISQKKAQKENLRRGRDSARAIIRMMKKPMSKWTNADWQWAMAQKRFLQSKKNQGHPLYKNGKPTRHYLELLVWGYDPLKGKNKSLLKEGTR